MQCFHPVVVRLKIKEQHGMFFDREVKGQPLQVPCGHCLACRKNLADNWVIRLFFELLDYNYKACFLTLTYNDAHLPVDRSVHKRDVQLFLKRLRKYFDKYEPDRPRLKYFCAAEYGELNMRPHYHMVLFGVDMHDRKVIEDAWQNGFISMRYADVKNIRYTVKYLHKCKLGKAFKEEWPDLDPPFYLSSKNMNDIIIELYRDKLREHAYNQKYELPKLNMNGRLVQCPKYILKKAVGNDIVLQDFVEWCEDERFNKDFEEQHEEYIKVCKDVYGDDFDGNERVFFSLDSDGLKDAYEYMVQYRKVVQYFEDKKRQRNSNAIGLENWIRKGVIETDIPKNLTKNLSAYLTGRPLRC